MAEELLFETERKLADPVSPHRINLSLRPILLLAGLVTCFSLQLELVVLEQIDSLSLYMTYGEIALDVGIALLILLAVAVIWWLCVLLLAASAKIVRLTGRHRIGIAWYVGLLVPFLYLILDLFSAAKTLIFPHWKTGWLAWLLISVPCLVGLLRVRVSQLQEFCRTRLVPIAWGHVILAGITVCALWVNGVHLFHNYARPAIAANSQLPDIYLVTLDALAAQDTSLYGYHLPTTPSLERFATHSFKFDFFFANSNFTASSTTSIETGKLPWSHRVFQQGSFLRGAAQEENIAAELHRRGYYTAMITSNQWAAPFRHRTLGSYDAVQYEAPLGLAGRWSRCTNIIGANSQYTLYGALLRRLIRVLTIADALIWPDRYPAPAEAVFDRARNLVQDTQHAQPRFVWTHILPPHDPYVPPLLTRKRFLSTDKLGSSKDLLSLRNDALPPGVSAAELRARYDEMVLYADSVVGDYLDWLDRTGRLDHAIVIVSSDHGESFEHGTFLHAGPFLYENMIQVPLLIHLPGQTKGVHISTPAQQADLLPTILDLVGAPVPSWTDGTSLQSALKGQPLPERFIFSMNLESDPTFGAISKGTIAVRDDEFKYVLRLNLHEEELYQYKTDPLEEHNLIASDPEVARRMRDVVLKNVNEVNARSMGKP